MPPKRPEGLAALLAFGRLFGARASADTDNNDCIHAFASALQLLSTPKFQSRVDPTVVTADVVGFRESDHVDQHRQAAGYVDRDVCSHTDMLMATRCTQDLCSR